MLQVFRPGLCTGYRAYLNVSVIRVQCSMAGRDGIGIVKDAADAFGSTYWGQRIGALGDIASFSFDWIKNITGGEKGW